MVWRKLEAVCSPANNQEEAGFSEARSLLLKCPVKPSLAGDRENCEGWGRGGGR